MKGRERMSASQATKMLKDFLDYNNESKLQTAHMLINFKNEIRNKNKLINKLKTKPNRQNLVKIRKISKQIISLISTWCIYIRLKLININAVAENIGGFLIQESKLIYPFVQAYLSDDSSEYHYDALDCVTLFSECKQRKEHRHV